MLATVEDLEALCREDRQESDPCEVTSIDGQLTVTPSRGVGKILFGKTGLQVRKDREMEWKHRRHCMLFTTLAGSSYTS